MDKPSPSDVCLVMRAPLSRYPPSLYQAALLREIGYRVCVLDVEDGGHAAGTLAEGVSHHVLARRLYPWGGLRHLNILTSWYSRLLFNRNLAHFLLQCAPRLVIAYEPPAIASVSWLARRKQLQGVRKIWHFHEYPVVPSCWRPGSRADALCALGHVNRADLVVFPDRGRLEQVSKTISFRTEPMVVMNCPRRMAEVPIPTLRPFLKERGITPSERLVAYFGSVGGDRGLLTTIQGINRWPENASLVLVGPITNAFLKEVGQVAQRFKVADRVHAVGAAPASGLLALQVGADVALTILEPLTMHTRYCAGASNKRFEAMAVGVPQVSDRLYGVPELVEKSGAGVCVPHDDTQAIGEAIRSLLTNPQLRSAMGAKARSAHLQSLNYETQFGPVMERIRDWLGHG